jgi:hypothetical protein
MTDKETFMRITKDDIPVRVAAPGATARQLPDFGVADGAIGAEYFSLAAGTDLAPLLAGLPDDACASPHWGFVIEGDLVVDYTDGSQDRCVGGDLFYWPAGHSVRVEADAELILFSPQVSHGVVLDHIARVLSDA